MEIQFGDRATIAASPKLILGLSDAKPRQAKEPQGDRSSPSTPQTPSGGGHP